MIVNCGNSSEAMALKLQRLRQPLQPARQVRQGRQLARPLAGGVASTKAQPTLLPRHPPRRRPRVARRRVGLAATTLLPQPSLRHLPLLARPLAGSGAATLHLQQSPLLQSLFLLMPLPQLPHVKPRGISTVVGTVQRLPRTTTLLRLPPLHFSRNNMNDRSR
jgi:hypothetical protein